MRASLVAQMAKYLLAMQETQVQSLDWEDPWRRELPSTPGFLPEEFHGQGQRSLAGYSAWGHKVSDMTERLSLHFLSVVDKYYKYYIFREYIHVTCISYRNLANMLKTSWVPDTFLNCRAAVISNKVWSSQVLCFTVKRQTANRKYQISKN